MLNLKEFVRNFLKMDWGGGIFLIEKFFFFKVSAYGLISRGVCILPERVSGRKIRAYGPMGSTT